MSPVIITAALNGSTVHRGQCPTVPYTTTEIVAEAQRATEAGASIIHVHGREQGGGPSYRVELYRELVTAIRGRCDALISVSAGAFGVGLEERLTVVEARPDLVTVPMGSMSWARYNPQTRDYDYDHVFSNPFRDLRAILARAAELDVTAIPTCWDMGHVASLETVMSASGQVHAKYHLLGLGITGGIQPTVHNLCRLADALPADAEWQLAARGSNAWRLRAAALAMGGHVRVGFEDGSELPDGEDAESNGSLVQAAAELVQAVGLKLAKPEQARKLL